MEIYLEEELSSEGDDQKPKRQSPIMAMQEDDADIEDGDRVDEEEDDDDEEEYHA